VHIGRRFDIIVVIRAELRKQDKGVDMPVSQSQRLRRAAEKASRRKVVVAEKRKAETASILGRGSRREAEIAASAPIHSCTMSAGLFEAGIGWVTLARTLPLGEVAASAFLVDAFCLGIKDAFFAVTTKEQFEDRMAAVSENDAMIDIEPSVALKLLRDAARYAGSFGLPPSDAFEAAGAIFGDIEMAEETFVFGKDGKPFFMSGPSDSPTRVRRILDALTKHAGPDGFEYMLGSGELI
jgi:hypothetical protein